MSTLYIIRGLPGSGKSTLANLLAAKTPGMRHYEADQHFMVDGEYRFDASDLVVAHLACFQNTKMSLEDGHDVVVANTFTTLREMRNYVEYANDNGHDIVVITCEANYGSIHNVPDHAIDRMRNRFASDTAVREFLAEKATNVRAQVRKN